MSSSARADKEGRKVFLGGLSFDAREDDLRADFRKFGDIEDLQLPYGEGGKHKGFAFITYFKAEDAQDACREHHQQTYLGREITCKVVVPRDRGGDDGGDRGGGGGRDYGRDGGRPDNLSREMSDKLDEWVAAKRRRDYETSDRLRAEMKDAGFNPETYRPKPAGGGYGGGGSGGGDRYDDRRGGDRYDDRDRYRQRSPSPDRRRDDRYDDRRGGDRDRYRQRSYSPDRRRGDRY